LALHSNRGCALLAVARLIDYQHRLGIAEVLDKVVPNIVPEASSSQTAPASRCCVPSGVASSACSASVQ
jgi:hypothetical protein